MSTLVHTNDDISAISWQHSYRYVATSTIDKCIGKINCTQDKQQHVTTPTTQLIHHMRTHSWLRDC